MSDQRIVLFDDSSLMRRLLTGLLNEAGYHDITAFSTLSEGWAYLDRPDVQINLILMDKALPDGDGIDAIKRIRATPHLTDKPVIMVTGFDDRDTLRDAFDAGATDFINKSFDEAALKARVRSALKLDAALSAFIEGFVDEIRRSGIKSVPQRVAVIETRDHDDGLISQV